MRFRVSTIAPDGRNKYGNYVSKGNTTKNVISTTYDGNATTTSIAEPETVIDTPSAPQYYVQIEKANVIFTTDDLASMSSKGVSFNGMRGTQSVPVYIMDLSRVVELGGNLFPPADNGITGFPNTGLDFNIPNNGTSATTIYLTANPNLTQDEGSLSIPVCIYQGSGSQPEGNDLSAWWAARDEVQQMTFTLSWTVNRASQAASVYRLSLSNDNASIICDSGGTYITGTTLPTCKAKTWYGSDLLTGATYNVDWGGVSGGSSAITNGVLDISFNPSTFGFTGMSASIIISAITGVSDVVDIKTMNLSKAVAGAPGADGASGTPATILWIEASYDEILFDPNTNTPSPTVLRASGWTQTGQNAPEPIDPNHYSLYYKMELLNTSGIWTSQTNFPETGLTITPAICTNYQRIRLMLLDEYSISLNVVDYEDIDILRHGTSGETGGVGRTGATIRGPYDYAEVSGTTRWWFNGEPSILSDESEKWIDVIIKDNVYYYCNTTYYGPIDWANNSDKWTSGQTFDFIATNLLLADNAKINFLTGNEIYLGNSGGTITAGIAGGSGSTPAFWAGNSEANPNFSVDHNGNMVAKSAKIFGNVYIPFVETTDLRKSGAYYYAEGNAHLITTENFSSANPCYLKLPNPTSAWSGFEYSILIPQYATSLDTHYTDVSCITTSNYIYDFVSSSSLSNSSHWLLLRGNFTFTCMKYLGNWVWALINTSPNPEYNAN